MASTSAYRRSLLERLGIPFEQIAPVCDERAIEAQHTGSPETLVERLAQEKAASVAQRYPHAVVIGSDQCAAVDDTILGKPGTAERAVDQLALLSGRTHRLCTAVCVYQPHALTGASGENNERRDTSPPLHHTHLDVTSLTMRDVDRAALQRYVTRDQPLDCAGAYKLECSGISLFSGIQSNDHSAITGLPLIWLSQTLINLGFSVP